MASLVSNRRLGILSAIHRIRLKVIIIFTYATVFSIPLFNKLPCPEAIFLSRKNRDLMRRCHMNSVIVEGFDIVRLN
jgi:hypothetical protein